MLGKLFTYELKASAHYFIALFAATLIMSIFNSIALNLAQNFGWLQALLIFIQILLFAAIGIMTMIVIISRFYKNLLGREGYLMFTLPVSTHHNILAKLLAGTTWYLASFLVIIVSIFIMTIGLPEFLEGLEYLAHYLSSYGIPPMLLLVQTIIVSLLSIAYSILLIYLALAVGQLVNELKFLAAVGFYIVFSIVLQIIYTIAMSILFAVNLERLGEWIEGLSPFAISQFIFLVSAAILLVFVAIYYFVTHRLLHRKLNLS
jgi:hypothetical protein